jgi:predicted membrane GTPase involved in stress response
MPSHAISRMITSFNVLKGKQLTNIRAAGKDEAVRLTPPIRMTLEKALAYIADDELVELTPKTKGRLSSKIFLEWNDLAAPIQSFDRPDMAMMRRQECGIPC